MTTKNIDEQKKYEYWLYQTNPLPHDPADGAGDQPKRSL